MILNLFLTLSLGWSGWISEDLKLNYLLKKVGREDYSKSLLVLDEIDVLDQRCQIEMKSQRLPIGCYQLIKESAKVFSGQNLMIPDLDKICAQNAKKLNQVVKTAELDKLKKSKCYEVAKAQNEQLIYAQDSAFFFSENK